MRPYTQSAQIRIHFIWACLAGVVLFFILGGYFGDWFASKEISPWLEAILVGWLFISGPLGFASYLIRAYRSWVAVDPEQGIIRRGRPAIPWSEIQWIEWKRPWEGMHRQESRMFPHIVGGKPLPRPTRLGRSRHSSDENTGEAQAEVFGFILYLVVFHFLVPSILIPPFDAYGPGDRVTIVTARERYRYCDLDDPEEFLVRAAPHARIRAPGFPFARTLSSSQK